MTYSTSALIDDLLIKSKDSTFSRGQVLTYLQATQDSVLGHQVFKFCEKRIAVTLNVADTAYTPPAGYQQDIQLILTHPSSSGVVEPVYMPNADFFDQFPVPEANPAAAPTYYTDFGGVIYFNCPVNLPYSLTLRYVQSSSELEDTTSNVPQIPREYSEIYTRGGLAGIEEFRENFDIAALHNRKVEDRAEDLQLRYGMRKRQPGKARTSRRRVVLS